MNAQGTPPDLALLRQPHRRVRSVRRQQAAHGSGSLSAANRRIAVAVTNSVGTMWAAYLFALLALVSLPAAITSGSTIVIVGWLAQTFLQLVLLPIIIVGQNVQASHADERAEADHETLTLLRSVNATQLEILKELQGRRR